jgi:hypothetical protein
MTYYDFCDERSSLFNRKRERLAEEALPAVNEKPRSETDTLEVIGCEMRAVS